MKGRETLVSNEAVAEALLMSDVVDAPRPSLEDPKAPIFTSRGVETPLCGKDEPKPSLAVPKAAVNIEIVSCRSGVSSACNEVIMRQKLIILPKGIE